MQLQRDLPAVAELWMDMESGSFSLASLGWKSGAPLRVALRGWGEDTWPQDAVVWQVGNGACVLLAKLKHVCWGVGGGWASSARGKYSAHLHRDWLRAPEALHACGVGRDQVSPQSAAET